jgi:hypothetical protein
MAILLVTYDLRQPGRNYQPMYDYLKRFSHCHGLESVWLLDTTVTPEQVRDALKGIVDSNDALFVVRLFQNIWNSWNYTCASWLNDAARNW